MEIKFHKRFQKQYAKLQERHKKAVDAALVVFQQDPWNPQLRNHPLKGEYEGARSIDASFDLRILFQEDGGYLVVYMLEVGTHSQLYGA